MKKKLLKKVAKLVVLLPEEKFDMESWASKNTCGTTFCAVGAAATLGIVPGMRLEEGEFSNNNLILVKNNKEYYNWSAVEQAFDLSEEDAEYLFSADAYVGVGLSQKEVANRINRFIEEDGRVDNHA